MGSFHVGGRDVTLSGLPTKEVVFSPGGAPATIDPNGTYMAAPMYAQYFLPADKKGEVPLLLWHGGGLTGVSYETTPDGREGWRNFFIKEGWDTYISDAVERGRSGWSRYPEIFPGEPVFLTKENPWERFRIGAGKGSYSEDPAERKMLEGNLFPAEGYENFVKQIVPRWTTTDEMTIAAYLAYIDKVCPCVIVAHSQGGSLAFRAVQQRPEKVKALVLIEPAGIGDPEKAAALKDVPMLLVYGDYIEEDARWPTIRANTDEFLEKVVFTRIDPEPRSGVVTSAPSILVSGSSRISRMSSARAIA